MLLHEFASDLQLFLLHLQSSNPFQKLEAQLSDNILYIRINFEYVQITQCNNFIKKESKGKV